MRKKLDLQLFADGGEGGSGAQGGNAGSGNGGQAGNAGGNGSYSFEQAEEIANARAQRAEQAALKSYFQQQGMTEEEVRVALTDYRANKEKQKPDVSALERERDIALSELAQLRNEKVLLGLNVSTDDMEYVMFRVDKLVTDKKDFKTAAEEFLKENPKFKEGGAAYRASAGAASGGAGGGLETGNESINGMIRSAFGRK